jgi:hypothetical protein
VSVSAVIRSFSRRPPPRWLKRHAPPGPRPENPVCSSLVLKGFETSEVLFYPSLHDGVRLASLEALAVGLSNRCWTRCAERSMVLSGGVA